MNKYLINYGCGQAILFTPYSNPEERFNILANTCFGIRKSILFTSIMQKEENSEFLEHEIDSSVIEKLSFNGDSYIWNKDGARKMLTPYEDDEWDYYYSEECKVVEL